MGLLLSWIASVEMHYCYLLDGKHHRPHRYPIPPPPARELALAELWHFCQSALAERADFISSKILFCAFQLQISAAAKADQGLGQDKVRFSLE